MSNMFNQKILGILFGILAGAMWSIEAILGKTLLSSLSFIQVAASESFFATITSFTYILLSKKPMKLKTSRKIDILFVGLIGSVLAPMAYFFGLKLTFAINATLLAHIQPLFVSILGFLFLGERLHKNDVIGGLMIGIAAILVSGRNVENLLNLKFNTGDLVILFATFCWALVAIPGKRLTETANSILIVGYRFLTASGFFIPLLLALNQLAIESIYQIILGVIIGLGYIFYYEGLKRIKASQVALTELSSPLFTAILAWFTLKEYMTWLQATGATLLIAGLIILACENY